VRSWNHKRAEAKISLCDNDKNIDKNDVLIEIIMEIIMEILTPVRALAVKSGRKHSMQRAQPGKRHYPAS